MKTKTLIFVGFTMMAIICAQSAKADDSIILASTKAAFVVDTPEAKFSIAELKATTGIQNGQNVLVVTNMVIYAKAESQSVLMRELFSKSERSLDVGDANAFRGYVLHSIGLDPKGAFAGARVILPDPSSSIPFTAVFKKPLGQGFVKSP